MTKNLFLSCGLMLALVFLVGCRKSDSPVAEQTTTSTAASNTFQANVSGAVSTSLAGTLDTAFAYQSFLTLPPYGSGTGFFALNLLSQTNGSLGDGISVLRAGDVPSVGTYSVGLPSLRDTTSFFQTFTLGNYIHKAAGSTSFFNASSGTFTVTSSTTDRVQGTFSFTAIRAFVYNDSAHTFQFIQNGDSVLVSGSFDAARRQLHRN